MVSIKRACVLVASCLLLGTLGAAGCTEEDEKETTRGQSRGAGGAGGKDTDGGSDTDGGADDGGAESDGGTDTDAGDSPVP